MTKLYLHIGTPKTGTTAIQHFMKNNSKPLGKAGVVYPVFEGLYPRRGDERNAHFLYDMGTQKGDACMARVCSLAGSYQTIVLSDEGIWRMRAPLPEFWTALKAALDAAQIELYVIVYLRRQDEYTYSFWAQEVKSWSNSYYKKDPFQKFMDEEIYEKEQLMLHYLPVLETIESAVGRQRMIVQPYERTRLDQKGMTIQEEFLEILGTKATKEYVRIGDEPNSSIWGNVLEAKRYLNRFAEFEKADYILRPYLLRARDEMKEAGTYRERNDFPADWRRAFLRTYEEENAEIARRYLNRADGRLFLDPIREDSEDTQEYTAEELTEVCARVMLHLMTERNNLKNEVERLEKKPANRAIQRLKGKKSNR